MPPYAKKSAPLGASGDLRSVEGVAQCVNRALQADDLGVITRAIGASAKARGMTEIARQTGLARENLYRALGEKGNPQFETIVRVLQALGLELRVSPRPWRGDKRHYVRDPRARATAHWSRR